MSETMHPTTHEWQQLPIAFSCGFCGNRRYVCGKVAEQQQQRIAELEAALTSALDVLPGDRAHGWSSISARIQELKGAT